MLRLVWFAAASSVLLFAVLVAGCGEDNTQTSGSSPTASFALTPPTGTTETIFKVDANASSDKEDRQVDLQVRWDWENDGKWDTGWSTKKRAEHRFGTGGTKTVRLEVMDTGGLVGTTTGNADVQFVAPPIEMVTIPAGEFTMGDSSSYCGVAQRQVTLSHNFAVSKYEVTNEQYRGMLQWAFDGQFDSELDGVYHFDSIYVNTETFTLYEYDPVRRTFFPLIDVSEDRQVFFRSSDSTFVVAQGKENFPVANVSWYGAAAYCDWVNRQVGSPLAYDHSSWECNKGNPYGAIGYRLPTDAEWEYAARYNDGRIYPWGNDEPTCDKANYNNCVGSISSVGSYPPAPASLGLYDMAGNVSEMCNDRWQCDLGVSPETDPKGAFAGQCRVLRGGSYADTSGVLRCALRYFVDPSFTYCCYGFRCARTQ